MEDVGELENQLKGTIYTENEIMKVLEIVHLEKFLVNIGKEEFLSLMF